ncbi:hypothetical protein F4818DRAFT_438560 [Hypoxylon cercidicola]|nr:hypothetical protein F4818DRAFT_438560 [Hypoxylon cercidicola]
MSNILEEYEELLAQIDEDIERWKSKEAKWRRRLNPDSPKFAKQVAKINAAMKERERCEEDRKDTQKDYEELKEELRKEREEDEAKNIRMDDRKKTLKAVLDQMDDDIKAVERAEQIWRDKLKKDMSAADKEVAESQLKVAVEMRENLQKQRDEVQKQYDAA